MVSIPQGASSVAQITSNAGAPAKMAFPKDLEKQPFWMSFSFYQYSMPDLTVQNIYYSDKGTIRLPLPNSMRDQQNVEFQTDHYDLLAGMAINQYQQGTGSSTGGTGAAIGTAAAAGSILGGGKDVAGLAGSQAGKFALQTNGVQANPFLTVMFKQPSFKEHSLEWTLAPSNETESYTINQMINTFKANMLPDQSGALGGTLLDRKSTRLNSSHTDISRMPSSA